MPICTWPSDRRRRPSGFTLLELMVSMVFLSVIMLLMVQMLSETSRTWTVSKRRSRAGALGAAMLDLAAQELQQARISSEFPLVVGDAGVSFWMAQPAGDDPYGGPARRGMARVTYQTAGGSGSFSSFRRSATNWVAGASRPSGTGAAVDVYPHVRTFRVTPLNDQGDPIPTGTFENAPSALMLYLDLAIGEEAEAYEQMAPEQRIRAVQRFQRQVTFPTGHGERRLSHGP